MPKYLVEYDIKQDGKRTKFREEIKTKLAATMHTESVYLFNHSGDIDAVHARVLVLADLAGLTSADDVWVDVASVRKRVK